MAETEKLALKNIPEDLKSHLDAFAGYLEDQFGKSPHTVGQIAAGLTVMVAELSYRCDYLKKELDRVHQLVCPECNGKAGKGLH